MKKVIAFILGAVLVASLLTGCGRGKEGTVRLEGSCAEILERVYANASLSEDMRNSMVNFETGELNEENIEYMIGTGDVKYTDSVYSVPMINVVPYQCVLLRVASGQDIGAAKEELLQHADPRKWICVEAESVAVENVGDVILVILGSTENVSAVREAFLALGE